MKPIVSIATCIIAALLSVVSCDDEVFEADPDAGTDADTDTDTDADADTDADGDSDSDPNVTCESEPGSCEDIGDTTQEQEYGCCIGDIVYGCYDGVFKAYDCTDWGMVCGYDAEKDAMGCV